MIEIFNYYSFPIAAVVLLIGLAMLLPKWRWHVRAAAVAGVAAIMLVGYAALSPGSSTVASLVEAEAVLASGKPVMMDFFSNTCAVCLASEPVVNRVHRELEGDVEVIRLNVMDPAAGPLLRRYAVFSTPTFIVLDSAGEEVYRQSGRIADGDALREALIGG